MPSSENKGIGANRTSYNEKQEVEAKVNGVLKNSTDIRNTLLNKNNGKYVMYDETLVPAIGEEYDVYERENNRPKQIGLGGLFNYTNTNSSEFGKKTLEKYYRDEDNIEAYNVLNPNPIALSNWGGKYDNYLQYVYNTYGKELAFINFLDSILSENELKFALNKDKVGVLRDINVGYSLGGVAMTNINNFSGKDTELGTIGNTMYARNLYYGAYLNSLRKTDYITSYLAYEYGNNLSTVNRLADLFPISEDTGRWTYDIGSGEYIQELIDLYGSFQNLENENEAHLRDYGTNLPLYDHFKDIANLNYQGFRYTPFNGYVSNDINNGKIYNSSNESTYNSIIEGDSLQQYQNENNVYREWGEIDYPSTVSNTIDTNGINDFTEIVGDETYSTINNDDSILSKNNLLGKTLKLFKDRKIATMIGRFHSSPDTDINHDKTSIIQTAISKGYGISHGRNLIKKGLYGQPSSGDNGYDNPYCRVWTYHHQYHQIKNLIRPFIDDEGNLMKIEDIQKTYPGGRTEDGAKYLADNTVLNNNSFVNITPVTSDVSIKKCMFSIENLAWRDVLKKEKNISKEQTGPLGGRIMWFPPYNLKFSENISSEWYSNRFIGRGEKIYSYVDTERTGTLSFTLLIDHPSLINYWKKGQNTDKSEAENDVLRFFAGCDLLEINEDVTNSETKAEETPSNEPTEGTPDGGSEVFYVYFPNNYSGVDDYPSKFNSKVDSMTYLFMGQGSQNDDLVSPDKEKVIKSNNDSVILGGYEMQSGNGISNNSTFSINSKYGEWYYRVDNEYIDQKIASANYKDNDSFQLNSKANTGQPSDATCTFAEFYAAVYGGVKSDIEDWAINCGANKENIDRLYNLIYTSSNGEKKTINKIRLTGGASSHGNENLNTKLNNNRKNTLKTWLSKSVFGGNRLSSENGFTWDDTEVEIVQTSSNSTDDKSAKLGRYTRVEIIYESPKSEKLSDTSEYATNEQGLNVNTNTILIENSGSTQTSDTFDQEGTTRSATNIIETATYNRYDGEGDFFTLLDKDSPIVRKMIVDKVKYFDPAFHSISPEGFNARLTFLHQCTRQGHTISTSDGAFSKTAGNLAFGRPPVCVLRIGDFYNTRIVIDAITIDYDPDTWDMNPEGIGVQPMFANINITFKFIGGSSLSGPIERLQNAVSFNYYANTGVYDDRADRVQSIDDNGNETYNIWTPNNEDSESNN